MSNNFISHRRSVRLQNYDYSSGGAYFVTICAKERAAVFGTIEDEVFIPNEFGLVLEKYWLDLPNHCDDVLLDNFTVMPDHIHGIIVLERDDVRRAIRELPLRAPGMRNN